MKALDLNKLNYQELRKECEKALKRSEDRGFALIIVSAIQVIGILISVIF